MAPNLIFRSKVEFVFTTFVVQQQKRGKFLLFPATLFCLSLLCLLLDLLKL